MTAAGPDTSRRVRSLLRWYPASWRARYGEEFAELLTAQLAEQPRSWRRTADVITSGLLARCTSAGLTRHELRPADQIRAGLATLGACLAAFAALGTAMLAQLATGWQWASPRSPVVATGTLVMTIGVAAMGVLGAAAIAPMAWQVARAAVRGERGLRGPAGLALASAAGLVAGARHFQNAWPGTGGTGAQHALVPGGLAAFGWASTLSVSSYWAHPALLTRFPLPELAWMGLSPLAGCGLVAGLVMLVRRLGSSPRLLRYQAAVAIAASGAAIAFLAGSAAWVAGHGPAESGLFRPGAVNGAELLVMAPALLLAIRAAAGIRRARRRLGLPG